MIIQEGIMGIQKNNRKECNNEEIFNDILNSEDKIEVDEQKSESSGSDVISDVCKKIFDRMDKTMSDLNSIINSIISNVFDSLERKLTFDEFLQVISLTLDKRILATQEEQRIKFISGKIIFAVNRMKKVLEYKADCYYQDAFKEWIKQEHRGYIKFSSFDKSAESQLKEIISKGKMELEIEPPSNDDVDI
jgi:hypothetical protein